jgi:SAM-dependent methyltransferase
MEKGDIERYTSPELYDLIYSWHTEDLPFYLGRAKQARGPVLEAGCGTGRVLIPAAQAGVDIDGIDIHPGMVAVLERKAAALGLHPHVVVADMRDFAMPRRYALVMIPFRAFMHLVTTEDQLRALRCVHKHLQPGGALVMNLFFPSFELLLRPEGVEHVDREFPHPETGLPMVMASKHWVDRIAQTVRSEREVTESDARGYIAATHRDAFTVRWTWKSEMELLLRAAGFQRFEVNGGFDGRAFTTHTDEMVWTAWKD